MILASSSTPRFHDLGVPNHDGNEWTVLPPAPFPGRRQGFSKVTCAGTVYAEPDSCGVFRAASFHDGPVDQMQTIARLRRRSIENTLSDGAAGPAQTSLPVFRPILKNATIQFSSGFTCGPFWRGLYQVVNIHLMRARAAFRCHSHAAISLMRRTAIAYLFRKRRET
jgi:hypothetical protein